MKALHFFAHNTAHVAALLMVMGYHTAVKGADFLDESPVSSQKSPATTACSFTPRTPKRPHKTSTAMEFTPLAHQLPHNGEIGDFYQSLCNAPDKTTFTLDGSINVSIARGFFDLTDLPFVMYDAAHTKFREDALSLFYNPESHSVVYGYALTFDGYNPQQKGQSDRGFHPSHPTKSIVVFYELEKGFIRRETPAQNMAHIKNIHVVLGNVKARSMITREKLQIPSTECGFMKTFSAMHHYFLPDVPLQLTHADLCKFTEDMNTCGQYILKELNTYMYKELFTEKHPVINEYSNVRKNGAPKMKNIHNVTMLWYGIAQTSGGLSDNILASTVNVTKNPMKNFYQLINTLSPSINKTPYSHTRSLFGDEDETGNEENTPPSNRKSPPVARSLFTETDDAEFTNI